MDKIQIEGGKPLSGEVQISGAKNSVLPLLFSSLLAPGEHIFTNVPNLQDVNSAAELLVSLGCQIQRNKNEIRVHVPENLKKEAHYDLVRKMRASILCLGPLLSRFGEAVVSFPGGCAIGTRPIDLHLDAMKSLGAEIILKEGYVYARASKLKGASYVFENATVGGTENLVMAASCALGTTVIENAAKEPEIVDLCDYLCKMGAQIRGHGTSVIRIEGVQRLKASQHEIIPDRIEAGTFLIAGAITRGHICVSKCRPDHLDSLLGKLTESGFLLTRGIDWIEIQPPLTGNWKAVDVVTQTYPLFPTDLQAQFMALMALSEGTSVTTETVFENRFMHVQELSRMGADITSRKQIAIVRGRPNGLSGAPVMATDLRASASLVLAGLAAQGTTTVNRIYHLDRGYENIEQKLGKLGAQIQRIRTPAAASDSKPQDRPL